MVRSSNFILEAPGPRASLKQGLASCVLHFWKVTLAPVWKMDYREESTEADDGDGSGSGWIWNTLWKKSCQDWWWIDWKSEVREKEKSKLISEWERPFPERGKTLGKRPMNTTQGAMWSPKEAVGVQVHQGNSRSTCLASALMWVADVCMCVIHTLTYVDICKYVSGLIDGFCNSKQIWDHFNSLSRNKEKELCYCCCFH